METKTKTSPKDFFTHLLSIIALYINAGAFIALIFDYINILFPDPLEGMFFGGAASSIRWSMALLFVLYPAYIFLLHMLIADYNEHPAHKELRIRKWLVYFTLFAASSVMAGDLIALIYNFLEGDLTVRFALKILVVIFVSGLIFFYYLRDLREQWKSKQLKILAYVISVVILAAVAAGFFTVGSPFAARKLKFDERRIGDLQVVQNEVVNYWMRKDKLPATLRDLKDDISGFTPPIDPQTFASYSYTPTSGLSFKLCADFSLPSPKQGLQQTPGLIPVEPFRIAESNWDHDSGHACFSRTIDPDIYRPSEKVRQK